MKDFFKKTTNVNDLSEVYHVQFSPICFSDILIPLMATVDQSLPKEAGVARAQADFLNFASSMQALHEAVGKKFGDRFNNNLNYFFYFLLNSIQKLGISECSDIQEHVENLHKKVLNMTSEQVEEVLRCKSRNIVSSLLNKYLVDNNG